MIVNLSIGYDNEDKGHVRSWKSLENDGHVQRLPHLLSLRHRRRPSLTALLY